MFIVTDWCTEVKPDFEAKVPRLRPTLNRVLFSPGVHSFQDPRTGMWNFEKEALHDIPQPKEFAYDRGADYTPPSRDATLPAMAKEADCKFYGSTSTLTKALSQIYFAISGGKDVDTSSLGQAFAHEPTAYSFGATLPATMVIDRNSSDIYSVDADKSFDSENILSDFGIILEKMLVSKDKEDFERFLRSQPDSAVPEGERNEREAFMYQKANTLLMRSQLDCADPRLPGTGVFDIKTRACVPIRFDRANWEVS
jgi:hypothetical protein